MKKYLSTIILLTFLLLPAVSLAALELQYPELGPEGNKIRIELGMDLNKLIAWFYYFVVGIAGFAAFIMLIWGGFDWLTSAGSPAKITEAKDKISSAFIGLLLILASYLILQVINPDLTTLNLPGYH